MEVQGKDAWKQNNDAIYSEKGGDYYFSMVEMALSLNRAEDFANNSQNVSHWQ